MRTPMNQSNICNQHYIIMHKSKASSNKSLQTKSLLTTPQDIPQTARRKLNSNPIHCRQKINQQNLAEK